MKDWEKEVYRQTPYYQSLANKYGDEYADASIGHDTNLGGKSKVRYARIPTGAETCAFCLMLASRGFVYRGKELASHAHSHCDCRIVPGFNSETTVEGYDEDGMYDRYRALRLIVEQSVGEKWKFLVGDVRTQLILKEMRRHDPEWIRTGVLNDNERKILAKLENDNPERYAEFVSNVLDQAVMISNDEHDDDDPPTA